LFQIHNYIYFTTVQHMVYTDTAVIRKPNKKE